MGWLSIVELYQCLSQHCCPPCKLSMLGFNDVDVSMQGGRETACCCICAWYIVYQVYSDTRARV